MVAIAPFRALRYAPDVVQDLSHVVAPPYDVITQPEQERLYTASPYNVVRLICGRQYPTDTAQDNRYTRARGEFDRWCCQQVLRRDVEPSLSLTEHTFTWNGAVARRLGFLGLLQLEGTSPTGAFPHEATLELPKADRTKLLEAVPANLSPIFCVYPDDGGAVQALVERLSRDASPTATVRCGSEVVRLWILTDIRAIRDIQRRLAPANLLIADGHHRYAVAYAHRARYGAVMAYFVSMADPALAVRPIHRLVRRGAVHEPVARLQSLCSVQTVSDLDVLTRWLDHRAPGRLGCYVGGTLYQVAVRDEPLARWLNAPSVPPPIAGLDVSLLHGLVLPHLGIGEGHLTYTAQPTHALRSVDEQESDMAWLLRAIPVEEVYTLASQGLILPPKSTFFYPKVFSGLAFNSFD